MRAAPSASSHLRESVTGLILAGGLARRMGGEDKGLVSLAGRPMVAHVLEVLRPQVGSILLNANRNRELYAALGHPVLADALGGYQGPLAGMLTALKHCSTEFLVTVPCDAPLVAPDLVARLHAACVAAGADLAVASDGERRQPVFLLLRASLAASLEAYLAGGGRATHAWVEQSRAAVADFSDQPDTFVNVNDPAERQRIEELLISRAASRPVACETQGQASR
jgi:molybdopterin-guanine dinucleotide biosynthesis protein A